MLHIYIGLTGPVRGVGGPSPQAMAPTGGSVASKSLMSSLHDVDLDNYMMLIL